MDTIFILNSHKQVIDVLSNNGSNPSAPFFDDTYKSELDTGAESYEFTTINNPRTNVTLEVGNYVLFKYNDKYKLFQIMETEDEHSEGKKLLTVYAEMAGMELLNDYCEPFSVEGNFITVLDRVLQDTNWKVGTYSASLLDNIQSVSYTEPKSVYSIIQENLATFGGVEIEFRVEFRNNQLAALLIDCYESGTRGNRKYRRFEYGKDVKGITRKRNINDLATAVIGQGNNGITFKDVEWNKDWGNPCDKQLQQDFVVDIEANDLWNNGGKYIKTVHKVDTDDPYTLLQECWDYLQEIKQPKFDYDVDLALVAEDYQDIGIGDTNYVLDFDYQPAILLEARVGTLELSFADSRDNKCVLTNYKELTSILQQPVDLNTVGNMIQSHFPIEGEDIAMGAIGEGHINVTYYQAIKTDFMSATLAEVGTLIADKADVKDLTVMNATIESLQANKADIVDLNATNGNITILSSQVGNIETLLAGNATAGDLQTIHLTASNAAIDDAVIKNAMIDSVSANKVTTGTINSNNVNIESEDGGIKISGATQQFKDKEGHVRVQIGKDASGNFTFCLFSQDGVGILLDETGIKAGAVPDGLIVNDMVSDGANISGSKLDISSVITQINNNETTISSSHIKFDDTGQSLLVAFNTLKNKVDTIEEVTISGDLSSVIEQVNTNTTQIGINQDKIETLIQNTTITKQDGTVVQLKDAYNQTVSTVNSNTTKIGTLETNYNKVTGDIASVTSKQSTLEQDLNGFKTTVSNTYATKSELGNYSTTEQMNSAIAQKANEITSTVADTYATKTTVTDLSNNLANNYSTTTAMNSAINQKANEITSAVSSTYSTKSEMSNLQTNIDEVANSINDNLTNNYSTTEQMNSAITQKANEITSTVSENFYTKGQSNSYFATKSEVTQTSNDLQIAISKTGAPNLITNGDFSSQLKFWYPWNSNLIYETLGAKKVHVSPTATSGAITFGVQLPAFDVEQDKTYTVAFWVESNKISILNYNWLMNSGKGVQKIGNVEFSTINGVMVRCSITFTSLYTGNVNIMLGYDGTYSSSIYFRIAESCCYEGTVAYPYKKSDNEIYTGITFVDMEGLGVKHTDGSVSKLTAEELQFTNTLQQKKMAIKKGTLYAYDINSGALLGMFSSNKVGDTYKGVTTGIAGSSHYYAIGATGELADTDELSMTPYMLIAQEDLTDFLGKDLINAGINFMNTNTIFHKPAVFKVSPIFPNGVTFDVNGTFTNLYFQENTAYLESHLKLITGGSYYGGGLYGDDMTTIGYKFNDVYTDVIRLHASIQEIDFLRPLNMNDFGIFNGYIASGSDIRVKHDIDEFTNWEDYYNFYMSLKPKTFKYNSDENEETHIGLIAQEVNESISENNLNDENLSIIKTVKDENMDNGKKYNIVYQELISLNMKMIQKHEKEIQGLKDIIAQQQELINQLLAEKSINNNEGE